MRVIDWGMIVYWLVALLACVGLIALPASAMYAGYGSAIVDAWNWSFAPLDLAFAITGLTSLRMASRNDRRWRSMALISLSLTFCAGLMAVSFWTLTGDFNPSWWLPNLGLLIFGAFWAVRLAYSPR